MIVAFPKKIIGIGYVNRFELGEKIRFFVQTCDFEGIHSQACTTGAGSNFGTNFYQFNLSHR